MPCKALSHSSLPKVAYIQSLLRVGFDSIDFGSFVSKSDSTNAGYRCCAWAIGLSQTKANYWLLLPIPEGKWLQA
jgi:hypothetical protein